MSSDCYTLILDTPPTVRQWDRSAFPICTGTRKQDGELPKSFLVVFVERELPEGFVEIGTFEDIRPVLC
jgi:hypothetical protein